MTSKAKVSVRLLPNDSFAHVDIHLAKLLCDLSGAAAGPELFLATALVSSLTREGHVCLDLAFVSPGFLEEKLGEQIAEFAGLTAESILQALQKAPVVGRDGDYQPLILDCNRLYLQRYWDYQQILVQYLRRMSGITLQQASVETLRDKLEVYFPAEPAAVQDWQKMAAAVALLRPFCVITGGPGTGKTYTVAKIMALLLEVHQGAELRIKLCAPTGKAAFRLQEAIVNAQRELPCPEPIRAIIPHEASTIHRLLGTIRHSPAFRHDAENPLELDVLIVDEASMVDLPLMAKLVNALPSEARLILLGDNNQLASVEAGAFLADVCGDAPSLFSADMARKLTAVTGCDLTGSSQKKQTPPIQDCIVLLQKSYRFQEQEGIGMLSRAINAGDAEQALEILNSDDYPEVRWGPVNAAEQRIMAVAPSMSHSDDINLSELFARFSEVRILCALRNGPQGARTLNERLEQGEKRRRKIDPQQRWYPGQPIIITENDYHLRLFNGDVGIALADPELPDSVKVVFPDDNNGHRSLRPFRLPRHETAYAMTVHKSQGSEFGHVLLLLPDIDSPILTRELVYTAVTRATKTVEIFGNEAVFRAAVERRIQRSSGLNDALWRG